MEKLMKAFVFDTNFIIQNKDLKEVVKSLEEEYSVYVTQVSINERISQQCLEIKKIYNDIEIKALSATFNINDYYVIKEKLTFKKACERQKKGVQKVYEELFKDKIIKYDTSATTFEFLLERAFNKIPPFNVNDKASDKGLKDSLMWLSLIEFFKHNGEDSIIFVSDDNGFKDQKDSLTREFKEATKKEIEIVGSMFYRNFLQKKDITEKQVEFNPLPDFSELRERVNECVLNICRTETWNPYSGNYYENTFKLREKVDANYMGQVFSGLSKFVERHIFNTDVSASSFLDLDKRVDDTNYNVPMSDIERLMKLYNDIVVNYSMYLEQFYSAVANIINRNFIPKVVLDEETLPF